MPKIIVQANQSDSDAGRVTLSEHLVATHLQDNHYATQLIERLAWAAIDASSSRRLPIASRPTSTATGGPGGTPSPASRSPARAHARLPACIETRHDHKAPDRDKTCSRPPPAAVRARHDRPGPWRARSRASRRSVAVRVVLRRAAPDQRAPRRTPERPRRPSPRQSRPRLASHPTPPHLPLEISQPIRRMTLQPVRTHRRSPRNRAG
jgi:hypothetical protein